MNEPIMIIGEPGTGKTTSIRTLNPKTTLIVNLANKRLSFKSTDYSQLKFDKDGNYESGNITSVSGFDRIIKLLNWVQDKHFTEIILDDFQLSMSYEMFNRIKEKTFDKWVDMGLGVKNVVEFINHMPEHILVYMLTHSEVSYDLNGNKKTKAKTLGSLIDKNLTLEGMTTIALGTEVIREGDIVQYNLITQNDGNTSFRSPLGMFDYRIPNDLQYVSDKVREYHGITINNNN